MSDHKHHDSPATVDEHVSHIRALLATALTPKIDTIAISDALGRRTTHAVVSPVDLPMFRNSQMDGFAVTASDLATLPAVLPIAGEVVARAGLPEPLRAGTAVRIMTGAPVPEGADTVIPVEDTSSDTATVTIHRAQPTGTFVRERGSDLSAGALLLPAGTVLAPRHLAALAAAGLSSVDVQSRVRVAIITSGAELVAPGEVALAGQIFDSNDIALESAIHADGASVSCVARVGDNSLTLLEVLREAARVSDLIITSGGISMGDYEVVRQTLEPLGATVGHIAMQPGGPQSTATFENVPVVSFPGNPVSTQISYAVFVSPLFRAFAGLPPKRRLPRILSAAITSVAGKRQFLKGTLVGTDSVVAISGPGSHLVAGLAAADVLIDVPEGTDSVPAGATVETWEL
ncbi:MAG: gephyrin-like molybdotransferase Glp [Microbacteriaceae bacterium]